MRCASLVRVVILAIVMITTPRFANASPEVGWWWNPNESGRGFFIEDKDGIIYLAGYFYEDDGRARWLVAGGPLDDPNSYDGRLLAYRDGQTLYGDYNPPSAPADAGAVSLRFVDDRHGTLTWPGGTIPIEREVFDTGVTPYQPVNGWWWNDAESGRGYSVEVRGDTAFIVGFMYDEAGSPVWYFSAGPMLSPASYEGDWLQFANGQTLTGQYRAPGPPVTVGHVALQFNDEDEATLTFSDQPFSTGSLAEKKGGFKMIGPEFPRKRPPPQPVVHPDRYDGRFSQTADSLTRVSAAGMTVIVQGTLVLTGNVTWVSDPDLSSLLPGTQRYLLPTSIAGQIVNDTVNLSYKAADKGGGGCNGSLKNVVVKINWDSKSTLTVGPTGAYTGMLLSGELPTAGLVVPCARPPDVNLTTLGPITISVLISGTNLVYGVNCKNPVRRDTIGATVITNTTQCSFAAVQ